MVLVHDPNQGQRVARELSDSARVVIEGPGLNSVLAGATILTVVLCIPHLGVWCSMIALAMGFSAYGEIIRRLSRGPTEEAEPSVWSMLVPRSIPKLILCSLMAAGTVVPLWLLNAGLHRSPRLDWVGADPRGPGVDLRPASHARPVRENGSGCSAGIPKIPEAPGQASDRDDPGLGGRPVHRGPARGRARVDHLHDRSPAVLRSRLHADAH